MGRQAGPDRERSSTSARGAKLLPKIRVLILISGDSLPDSSCRPGLCHCVSTVFGKFLEPRLRGFALSALDRQLWRLSSRPCMSKPPIPRSSAPLNLSSFCLAHLTVDNLRQHPVKASTVLQEHAHRLFSTGFFVSIKATLANPTCQSPDGRASAGLIPRALRT